MLQAGIIKQPLTREPGSCVTKLKQEPSDGVGSEAVRMR